MRHVFDSPSFIFDIFEVLRIVTVSKTLNAGNGTISKTHPVTVRFSRIIGLYILYEIKVKCGVAVLQIFPFDWRSTRSQGKRCQQIPRRFRILPVVNVRPLKDAARTRGKVLFWKFDADSKKGEFPHCHVCLHDYLHWFLTSLLGGRGQ